MRLFISIFIWIALVGSPVIPVHGNTGQNTFLKDYPDKGRGTWLKIDPPIIPDRHVESEKSLIAKTKSLIDGFYVQFDKAGRPKTLMICEIRFFEKGAIRAKRRIDTSQWSSQLAMIAQYYDEAAGSFRAGDFIRSTYAPRENGVFIVPGYRNGKVSVGFDTQKRQWTLFGPKEIMGFEITRRIHGLYSYLKKAAGRSVPYVYEMYTAVLSDGNRIEVADVDTHQILPPGYSPSDPSQDGSLKSQAGIRKAMLGDFLSDIFKWEHDAEPPATVSLSSPAPATIHPDLPPVGGFVRTKRVPHTRWIFRRSDKNSSHSPKVTLDQGMGDVRKSSVHPQLFYAMNQRISPDFPYPLFSDKKTGPGFTGLPGMERRGNGLYDNPGLSEPKGPVMDLRAGIILGAGVGMEATFLGMSILPAGGAAYVSTLSGLVGGASILTGGVILAAAAAGASIQYLLHLQDVKVERERVERLLERVSRGFTRDSDS